MSEYTVERLEDPSNGDIAAVLNLFKDISGRTCTAAEYLEYLHLHWIMVALFVVRKDGKVVGFTQAEAPGTLDPKCAWLPYSHATCQCPHKWSVKAVELAIEWMKGFGATKFKCTVTRNVKSFERLWKMRRSKEVLLEKDIT